MLTREEMEAFANALEHRQRAWATLMEQWRGRESALLHIIQMLTANITADDAEEFAVEALNRNKKGVMTFLVQMTTCSCLETYTRLAQEKMEQSHPSDRT